MTTKNDISHLEDELSRLTKKLQEEGESDEITLDLDNVLGRLADQLLKEKPQPNLIERIRMRMADFLKRILERIKQRTVNKLITICKEHWKRRKDKQ